MSPKKYVLEKLMSKETLADKRKAGAGDKETGHGVSVFSKDGAIGKQFTAGGNIGQIGEKVGGQ